MMVFGLGERNRDMASMLRNASIDDKYKGVEDGIKATVADQYGTKANHVDNSYNADEQRRKDFADWLHQHLMQVAEQSMADYDSDMAMVKDTYDRAVAAKHAQLCQLVETRIAAVIGLAGGQSADPDFSEVEPANMPDINASPDAIRTPEVPKG